MSNLIFSLCVWGDTLLIACIWGGFLRTCFLHVTQPLLAPPLPLSADVTMLISALVVSHQSLFVVNFEGGIMSDWKPLHLDKSISRFAYELRGSFSSSLPLSPCISMTLSSTESYRKVGQMPRLTLGFDRYALCIHYTTKKSNQSNLQQRCRCSADRSIKR